MIAMRVSTKTREIAVDTRVANRLCSSNFRRTEMRLIALCVACVLFSATGLHAADLVSGTWTTGEGSTTRVYVLMVSGDRLTGIMCGPCDDPASVFRIEDGRILDADHATFFIQYGTNRERIDATLARNVMKLSVRPEADSRATPRSISLTRVVDNFELNALPLPPAPEGAARAPVAPIEGRWVSVGRTAQQNWILKVRGNDVWGLVCGPCTPLVVTMIDGRIDGDTIVFRINHIDTPPNPDRKGIQRNVMTGTITGGNNTNVMKFKWVSEGTTNTGEIMMIGPVR